MYISIPITITIVVMEIRLLAFIVLLNKIWIYITDDPNFWFDGTE